MVDSVAAVIVVLHMVCGVWLLPSDIYHKCGYTALRQRLAAPNGNDVSGAQLFRLRHSGQRMGHHDTVSRAPRESRAVRVCRACAYI
jgi:hypothetical protein